MALLKFLKGNYSNLNNATIAEGQILICGDTGEMFVDVAADKRVKIGDFITVANIAALEALDATAVPTSRLYYVEDGNILARSNGTTWVQVNKQKTADELKTMLGLGSMAYVSEVSEANLSAELAEKVNASAEGNHAHSNKDVIDGITAEKVAAWDAAEQNAKDYADGKDEAIAEAKKAGDDAQSALDEYKTANDEAVAGVKATADAAAVRTEVESALAGKVDKVEGKSLIADSEIERLANVDNYNDAEVRGLIGDNADAIAALGAKVGEVPEDKTVVQMIADAKSEATYDDTQVKADIKANADAIDAIEADYLKAADKTELSDAIAAEKERAEGIEGGLRTDVDAIKADYLKAADKEALQNQINLIMNNPDTEGVINSIEEFTNYINTHGEIAEGFRTDIDKNKEDIAANAKAIADQATADEATYETKVDATAKLSEAKTYADGLNTAMDTRVKALEEIDHDAYVDADAALKTELQAEIDADVKALADGAVATNAANIAANAEAIATKANAADVYAKTETYTKTEVESLLTWGSF